MGRLTAAYPVVRLIAAAAACCTKQLHFATLCRLTAETIQEQGMSFQQGIQLLKSMLPPTAVLIGQNIGKDVEWLQLREGKDFQVSLHTIC